MTDCLEKAPFFKFSECAVSTVNEHTMLESVIKCGFQEFRVRVIYAYNINL